MTEPTKPSKDDKNKENEQAPKRQRPSREEQEEYFRKAAEQDLAMENLFAKKNKLDLAACLWS
jgi:hypothetical protein